MNDNELDDLFRSNAKYLAEQSPADFDKEAFWQQLNSALPKQADKKRPRLAWVAAAAVIVLAGGLGALWWMQNHESPGNTEQGLARQVPAPGVVVESTETSTLPESSRDPQVVHSSTAHSLSQEQKVPSRQRVAIQKGPKVPDTPPPHQLVSDATPPALIPPKEYSPPRPVAESNLPAPEVLPTQAVAHEPRYRVVHINEITNRREQAVKTRSRMALRIGVPPSVDEVPAPSAQPAARIHIPIR